MPKKKAAGCQGANKKKTKTGPTPAEKLADELDDLMIAYLKASRDAGQGAGPREENEGQDGSISCFAGSRDRRAPELGRRRVMRRLLEPRLCY